MYCIALDTVDTQTQKHVAMGAFTLTILFFFDPLKKFTAFCIFNLVYLGSHSPSTTREIHF